MTKVPLTIQRYPPKVRRALNRSAQVSRRSVNAEVLSVLQNAEMERPVTCHEWAQRLREARKLLTKAEHNDLGKAIEKGIKLMRREHLH